MSVAAISSAICETVKGRAILVHRTQREIGTTRRIGKLATMLWEKRNCRENHPSRRR